MTTSPFRFKEIGPWSKGINNILPEAELPLDALQDAVNVDLMPNGLPRTRTDWERVYPGSVHSFFVHNDRSYGVVDDLVGELTETGFVGMGSAGGEVHWATLNGEVIYSNPAGVFRLGKGQITDGLNSDEYDLDDQLSPLPGGHWVAYWNGRLVVARGSALLFSEPLRYGAYNPRKGYIQLESRIEWFAELEEGIFVGLKDKVLFLQGRSPLDMKIEVVAGTSAPGMALVLSGENFALGDVSPTKVAVFFTKNGFTIGLPSGEVTYPQRGSVNDLPLFRGKLIVDHNRIYAVRGF